MAAPAKPAETPSRDAQVRDAQFREGRLATALRENLKRRKAQIREKARALRDKSKSPPEEKTGG
jgi:hypothetical protein